MKLAEFSRRRLVIVTVADVVVVVEAGVLDVVDTTGVGIDRVNRFEERRVCSACHGATTSLIHPNNSSSLTTTFHPKKANNSRSI
jgi:hypothetical protein